MAIGIAQSFKRLLRRVGLQVRRAGLGQELWADLEHLLLRDSAHLILDVGANRGQAARHFAARFPAAQIVSFEPSPQVFEKLIQQTAHLHGVAPVNLALGSEETSKTIYINQNSTLTSLLPINVKAGWGEVIDEAHVPVTTLDRYAATERWSVIDLLKTDTQGFDLEVLKGAAGLLGAHRIRLVQTEVNFAEIYQGQASFEGIYGFLTSYGFKMVGLYNGHYYDDPYIWWADALFIDLGFVGGGTPPVHS